MSIQRLHELTDLLKYHSHKYYVEDNPEISDYEYDMLSFEGISVVPEYQERFERLASEALEYYDN